MADSTAAFMATANRLPTLYELDDAMVAVLALIEDSESSGEEPSEGLEAQRQTIETLLAQKVENYVGLIRSLEHLRDARKVETDRMAQRVKTADNAVHWLKARLLEHMANTGQQRIETGKFTVRVQKNSVVTCDVLMELMVPNEFRRTVVTSVVDKKKIVEHTTTTGEVVPGTNVYRGEHLRVS